MKKCSVCGAMVDDDVISCPYCGERITVVQETSTDEYNDEDRTIYYENIEPRDLLLCLVLSLITFGIYGLYWLARITSDLNELTNDTRSPKGWQCILYLVLTLGIYKYFWAYRYGKKFDELNNNDEGFGHLLFLVLSFFSLDVVNFCILQDAINRRVSKNTKEKDSF